MYEVRIADIEFFANCIVLQPVLAKNPKETWKTGQWFFTCCDDYIRLAPRRMSKSMTMREFFNALNDITNDACSDERLLGRGFVIHNDIPFDDKWNQYKELLSKVEEKQNGSD